MATVNARSMLGITEKAPAKAGGSVAKQELELEEFPRRGSECCHLALHKSPLVFHPATTKTGVIACPVLPVIHFRMKERKVSASWEVDRHRNQITITIFFLRPNNKNA